MLIREDRGDIAVIRMSHGKVNAMDEVFCTALAKEIGSVRGTDHRALVITGTGRTFSAGVDLKWFLSASAAEARQFFASLDDVWRACLTLPQPVVAAVNGHALAGGCILAASCDFRVTSTTTGRIGVPELAVGVPFPSLPFEVTAARVAPGAFRRLVFLGETMSASEALAAGLTEETIGPDQLMDRAIEVAQRIGAVPPASFQIVKDMHNRPILERARATDALNDRAIAAWLSPEVRASISRYLGLLSERSRS